MNIISKGLTALALVSTLAVSGVVPAQAQSYGYGQRDRVITSYCDRNRGDRDCGNFRRGGWNNNDYNRFYGRHRSGLDSIASGLFGFGFGAIIGGAIANSNNNNDRVIGRVNTSSHVDACYARYRSYDARSDSYLGFDGNRHRCNL